MLVFLLWTVIVIITLILIVSLIIFFSNIRIEINSLEINYGNNEDSKFDFDILLKTYLFNFIKISEIKIDKNKVQKCIERLEDTPIYIKLLENKKFDSEIIKTVKKYIKIYKKQFNKSPVYLKSIFLKLEFGLIDGAVTTYIASLLSILLGNLLYWFKGEYYKFNIIGNIKNNSMINIKLLFKSIITINMKHIIIILLKMILKGVKENDRTSYRGLNEYSYE